LSDKLLLYLAGEMKMDRTGQGNYNQLASGICIKRASRLADAFVTRIGLTALILWWGANPKLLVPPAAVLAFVFVCSLQQAAVAAKYKSPALRAGAL
jgi:hypothetical protein